MEGRRLFVVIFTIFLIIQNVSCGKYRDDKTKCPMVKAMRIFDLNQLLGRWYVVQYYASSEEELSYKCMRAEFTQDDKILSTGLPRMQVTMNFTYIFINDPLNEQLLGNITWDVPDHTVLAHWVHAEDSYEGVYNTYALDTDYTEWALLMHCAEKQKSTRYLSAFILSRKATLGNNVISYLKDKLPKYDIDLNYMFEMSQENCEDGASFLDTPNIPPLVRLAMEERKKHSQHRRKHPMKRVHRKRVKLQDKPTSQETSTSSTTENSIEQTESESYENYSL